MDGMKPTLVVLAAGMGSRYGGLKQVDPVGPSGEAIIDYTVFDAVRSGFGKVVFVIRRDFEAEFRARIGAKFERAVDVAYCFQELGDLPPPFAVPPGRAKPWGTAHAVRAARGEVRGPFAVVNADDFYGRDAFARLSAFLSSPEASGGALIFAMVGFRLGLTLSEHGSVARGVCDVAADGTLRGVRELTKLVRAGDAVEDRATGARVPLGARVSMNCWGFSRGLLDEIERRFPAWLAENAEREGSEWYIPFVVDELIREERAVCRVLPTESPWFGVTYREDRPAVAESVRALVEAGEYPCDFTEISLTRDR